MFFCAGGPPDIRQASLDPGSVAFGAQPLERFHLLTLVLWTDLDDLDAVLLDRKTIDAHNHPATFLDRLLEPIGAFLNGFLGKAVFNTGNRAATPIDFLDERACPRLQLAGER